MCKHEDCPYKYCPYHKNYDEELEVICKWIIPDIDNFKNCIGYLDI